MTPGPYAERQPQHDAFDAAARGRPATGHSPPRPCSARRHRPDCGGSPARNGRPGRVRLAVDLDRAGEHDAANAGLRPRQSSNRRVTCTLATICGVGSVSRPDIDVRATGEMHDRIDAGQRRVPLRRREIPQRHDFLRRRQRLFRHRRAHRRDMRDALLRQMRAQCAADEASGPGDEDLARRCVRHAHFQPCLLKKRAPLRVKYAMCRHPLRAAPPP